MRAYSHFDYIEEPAAGGGFWLPDPRLEMPELLIPGRKPVGPVEIDRDHPVGAVTKMCYLAPSPVEIDGPGRMTNNGYSYFHPDAYTVYTNTTDRYFTLNNFLESGLFDSTSSINRPFWILMQVFVRQANTGYIFSFCNTAASNKYLTISQGSTGWNFYGRWLDSTINNSDNYWGVYANNTIKVGERQTVLCGCTEEPLNSVYVDGNLGATGTWGMNWTDLTFNSANFFGIRDTSPSSADGHIVFFAAGDTLTPAEVNAYIGRDPYQFLIPR